MIYCKELFWSKLIIDIKDKVINDKIIDFCFETTKNFEKKYSRFIKWNYLYKLNQNKKARVDEEFLSILRLSKKVSSLTDWYFDITILPLLENIGYWIYDKNLKTDIGYENIEIKSNMVFLKNWVSIDLWAVWKWYIVDKIYNTLDSIFKEFMINFWGDIKVKGRQKIYLEDPLKQNKSIWEINIKNLSISSSNPYKRKTNLWHHLINPKSKKSCNDKIAIYLTHKLSSFSDIFSTALFVTPLKKSIRILNSIDWLEWLIISKNWEVFKTKWFNVNLNKKLW